MKLEPSLLALRWETTSEGKAGVQAQQEVVSKPALFSLTLYSCKVSSWRTHLEGLQGWLLLDHSLMCVLIPKLGLIRTVRPLLGVTLQL